MSDMARVARDEGHVAGLTSLARTIALVNRSIAQLTPPAPSNPNTDPLMIAAAERARAKLHDMLGRLIDSGS
jgi:hypothetical protein